MSELGSMMPQMEVFNRIGKIDRIYDPNARLVLDWFERLDGRLITELVIGTPRGWLTIAELNGEIGIGLCAFELDQCHSRLVSRQDALPWLIKAMHWQGLPSD